MVDISSLETGAQDTAFSTKVKVQSGVNLSLCYQCFTCTLSCPLASAMDFWPNQVLRMVQLGLKDKVLQSSAIWLCDSCQACATRCPYGIDIPRVMDVLRQTALEMQAQDKDTPIVSFHKAFLHSVERRGRQHELDTLLPLKLRTKDFYRELALGWKMLWKGKLTLLPRLRTKGMAQIRNIFKKREAKA